MVTGRNGNGQLEPLFGKEALDRRGLSRRQAAKRAKISDTRWGQIVAGYEYRGGHELPGKGPAGTIARMAEAIGVTADELRAAGRPDAAAALETLHAGEDRVLLREASEEQLIAELARRAAERSA